VPSATPAVVISAETCGGNKSGVTKRKAEAGSAKAQAKPIIRMMATAASAP
jgi:hypothetical protein